MRNATWLAAVSSIVVGASAHAALPHATCRNGNIDRAESGMSGETTKAEIDSGANKLGFNCNVDLVGQYQGEGASWQLTAWKNCAYYDQRLNPTGLQHPGVVVLDVSDPSHPKQTTWLQEPAMLDPWESLKVNPKRQLLAGAQRPTAPSFPGTGFAIYDISQDCAHPQLKASVNFPGSSGHTGQWAPDGLTYYITPILASPSLEVIDTSDASNPKVIPCAPGSYGCGTNGFFTAPSDIASPRFHDIEFSKDGNTLYVANFASGAAAATNGLLILDVSDFQQRKPNPAFRKISNVTWDDGSIAAQNALPITIAGKPYILFTDEAGNQNTSNGCPAGKSPNGFPRLIDISDPANPKIVAKLQLDVHDPANCAKYVPDLTTVPTTAPVGGLQYGYSCHYCNVDDPDDAHVAACNCFAAGLRIFDISKVNAIHEIGYYKAPAQGTKSFPGSQYSDPRQNGSATFVRNHDWATSKVSFPKDRGDSSGDIWSTSQDNGFLVVHLDQGGGGCTSAEGSLGGLVALGVVHLFRRRKATPI
jgi:hypothetical protein